MVITAEYLDGIKDGRSFLNLNPGSNPTDEISSIRRTMRGFPPSSQVGQHLRGQLDFWRHQQTIRMKEKEK